MESTAKAILTLFFGGIFLCIYFLPAMIAIARTHHQRFAIGALNLLLGWTVLGWIVSIVWSFTATKGDPA